MTILLVGICITCPLVISAEKRNIIFTGPDENTLCHLYIHNGSFEEEILPYWSSVDDIVYYCIPSFLEKKIYGSSDAAGLLIDGESIGASQQFVWEKGKTYNMSCKGGECFARFMSSSSIPSLFISTQTGSMEGLHSSKEYNEKATMTIIDPNGTISYSGSLSMHGRGNWTYEGSYKKPFHLTLDKGAKLLGMGKNKDWLLLANSFDHSYMNNKLGLDMAQNAGFAFAPDTEYVDVYFNGQYWGLYLLTESVKVGKNRVDITDLAKKNELAAPDIPKDITGGYLLERDFRVPDDKSVPSWFITDDHNTHVRIRSPEYASPVEVEYISGVVNEMEQAINAYDGYSSIGKYYLDYIDVDSFANACIIAEISYDLDIGLSSTFFYKDADEIDPHIYMGPMWDFDQAFGAWEETASPEVLYIQPGSWFESLYRKQEFRDEVRKNWERYYSNYLSSEAPRKISQWQQLIRSSVEMDLARWDRSTGYDGIASWPRVDGTFTTEYSFDEEVNHLENWILRRHVFLDSNLGN